MKISLANIGLLALDILAILSLISCFMYGFFNVTWWVPMQEVSIRVTPDFRQFVILVFHVAPIWAAIALHVTKYLHYK